MYNMNVSDRPAFLTVCMNDFGRFKIVLKRLETVKNVHANGHENGQELWTPRNIGAGTQ